MSTKQRARRLAREIRKGGQAIHREWLDLGETLHEFREIEGWLYDGSGALTFREWCAEEGRVAYQTACQYAQIYRTYVLGAGLKPRDLADTDAWKLAVAATAVDLGEDVGQVMASMALPREEFADRYARNPRAARDVVRGEIERLSRRDGSWRHASVEDAAIEKVAARPELREWLLGYALRQLTQEAARVTDDEGVRVFQRTYAIDGSRVNKLDADLTLSEVLEVERGYRELRRANGDREDRYRALFKAGADRLDGRDFRTTTLGELLSSDEIASLNDTLVREAA